VGLLNAVNACDVGMAERREDFGFALKSSEPVGVSRKRLGQDLESDIALQSSISGAIDFAHAAGADRRNNLVRAYSVARIHRHCGSSAGQFSTTCIAVGVGTFFRRSIKKRFPSGETS